MPNEPQTTAEVGKCVTCGRWGGLCRWTDDAEVCMRKQLEELRATLREIRRNNYNAAIEKAAEECDRHAAFCKKEAHAGGDWKHLITRADEAAYLAKHIRLLTLRGSDDGAGQSAGWGWDR